MSKDIIVSVKRSGAVVLSKIPLQIDNISPIVIAGSNGAIPNYSYFAFSLQGVPAIVQGDLLTDMYSGTQYRVSGLPEAFDNDYSSFMIERIAGVGP